MLHLVTSVAGKDLQLTLDEIARNGAKKMLIDALQAAVAEYIERHTNERGVDGRALVVRNGKAKTRKVTLGCGTIGVEAPRVNDRRPGQQFSSGILPPYLRKLANVETLLPLLYLKGLSTSAFPECSFVYFRRWSEGLIGSDYYSTQTHLGKRLCRMV